MKVYASFVTYHPDEERFRAAYESVASQVDKVIVIDNTPHNEGMARALNKAFGQARAEDCGWLITFDQDSIAPAGLVKRLMDDISGLENVGQIGPAYTNYKSKEEGVLSQSHIITSASLTSVAAWHSVGGFREDYFIDYVDVEFSLRLRRHGFKVLMDTGVVLEHRLGEGISGWDIFGKKRLGFTDHVPVRWYYAVRNCCYLSREYKTLFPESVMALRQSLGRRILRMIVNGRDKMPRMKMVSRGITDYRKGITGPFSA